MLCPVCYTVHLMNGSQGWSPWWKRWVLESMVEAVGLSQTTLCSCLVFCTVFNSYTWVSLLKMSCEVFIVCIYLLCVHVCVHGLCAFVAVQGVACIWKSKDNLSRSVLSFHHVGFGGWDTVAFSLRRLCQPHGCYF